MKSYGRLPVFLMLTAVIAALGAGNARQDRSWVGESVLPTKLAKDIKFGDRDGDKPTYFPFSGRWPFKVREEKDGWLRIHDGRREGWVEKADFVLARESFTYFDGRVRANQKDAFALAMRGAFWLEKKEPTKAIVDFDACIQLNATDSSAFNNRGLAWAAMKDYDKAIADYSEALRLNPKAPVTHYNRGNAWKNKREFEKAILDFDEALRLDPRYANALYGRGVSWSARKEYDKAIKDFDETIAVDAKFVAAFNDRGLAWVAKKEYEKGIKDYNEALRLNPKNTVTFLNRAVAWKTTRQFGKAIADYEEVIRLDAKHARARSNLSWIMATCLEERHRNGTRAVELATKACQLTDWKEPNHIDVLAAAHAEVGDFAQAIRYEKQALETPRFQQQFGDQARKRLRLYEDNKPYRE